jgi:aromatic ring-cleaving dioxygenase
MVQVTTISGYHAHVYFDAASLAAARALCERVRDTFGVAMGRVHVKNVGPHPRWSCQLAFGPDKFAEVVPWLALNRAGLTVFVHPETGDAIADHTRHALWMGEMLDLDLAALV